jgi:hypothetical protein
MAVKTFAALVPQVAPSVPGAPQPLIIKHIRDAAIRACETSLLWRYAEPTYALQPGSHENFFRKPNETAVHAVFRAMCNNRTLERLTLEDALDKYPQWADRYNGLSGEELWALTPSNSLNTEEYNNLLYNGSTDIDIPPEATAGGSTPCSITQISPDKYVVLPLPDDQVYTMRLFYALKPTRNASGMDETIMDELEQVIAHGALQQLLVMPKVVWNDNTLASYHARQYLSLVNERRARANLNNSRASLTARMVPLA